MNYPLEEILLLPIGDNTVKDEDKFLGQVMEIGAMEVTKSIFYRNPQFSPFRDEKNARACIVGGD
ncbi:MAG TPA: hypothetical protein VGI33_14580 [Paenibacillus sp.]|jgi:hypothetical protein